MKQLAVYSGPFGKVRILERLSDGARSYSMGGGLQTLIDADGISLFGYVNALKLLLRGRNRVLMIGGGGGSLASMLVRKGHSVSVVDIDPMAESIAKRFFDLDPRVRWHTADGLKFPKHCSTKFDAVVVDACTGRGTVEAFTRPEWLSSVMDICSQSGVLMLNLAYNLPEGVDEPTNGFALAEELSELGLHSILLTPDDGISHKSRGAPLQIFSRQKYDML